MTTPRALHRTRLAPVDQPDDEISRLYELTVARDGQPLNIFRTAAHNPRILEQLTTMAILLLGAGTVPDRERELAIMRVAWRTRSDYEFGQHRLFAAAVGVTDHEMRAVCRPLADGPWNDRERLVLIMTDELVDLDDVTDDTWASLAGHWSPGQLVELLALVGFYRAVAAFLNATGVEREMGIPGFFDDQSGADR